MPLNRILATSLVAGIALFGASYFVAPRLQGAQRRTESEASIHLERARRILHQYNAELDYQTTLLGQLRDGGVTLQKADDLPEDAKDEYQKTHEDLWESFEPVDRSNANRSALAKANYSNIGAQVRDGLAGRDKLTKANEKLLGEAMAAVDEALAVTIGDESARSHAEANRLKGTIQYHQGLALRIRAASKRSESVPFRSKLVELAGRVKLTESGRGMADGSGCDAQAESLRKQATELGDAIDLDRKQLTELDGKIADLEKRAATAEARRNQASAAMEDRLKKGINLTDTKGAEAFRAAISEQDRVFRDADREAHAATHGDFPNAKIDATGDFLTGKYLEKGSSLRLTTELGVLHYRGERKVLAARIAGKEAAKREFEAGAARLTQMRDSFAVEEKASENELAALHKEAGEVFDALNEINAEAFAIEEKSLDLLSKAAGTLKQAAGFAATWVSNARDQTDRLKPETQERSGVFKRTKDGWMGGFTQAQAADPLLTRAWIFCDRYTTYAQTAALLANYAESLALGEADATAETVKSDNARTAGVDAVKQAMALLEKAHKDVEKHWTIVAQAASTEYLLALLGDPAYVTESIDSYRKALQGREDAVYAQPIAARLRSLESSK